MRGARAGLLTVGACLIAIGCCAPSAWAAPYGTLTAQEYTLVGSAQSALKQALRGNRPNWSAAQTACLSVGSSTTLLARQGQSCVGQVTLDDTLASFPAEERRCPKPETRKIPCIAPLYRALAGAAAGAYASDVKARQAGSARGFTGTCLTALSSTPTQLRNEHKLATSTNKLAADMTSLVNVLAGQTPPSKLDQTHIDADVNVFQHYVNLVLGASTPDELTVCPHQSA